MAGMTEAPSIHRVTEIDARLEDGSWAWAASHRAAIDRHWAVLRQANPALFDGRVLIAVDRTFEGEALRVRYRATDYASFLTFRDLDFPDPGTCNCFGMAALRSADGAFLLGVMAPHTANAGRIYFPAGTPEPADVTPNGEVDLLANVLRELEEETGIGTAEVTVGTGWTAVVLGGRTALMREVRIALPAEALVVRLQAFLKRETLPEFASVRLVTGPDDIDHAAIPTFVQAYLRHAFEQP